MAASVQRNEDLSLIEIFQNELSTHLAILSKGLETLRAQLPETALLSKMEASSREIAGGAKITGLVPIAALSKTLEQYFEGLRLKTIPFAENQIPVLLLTVNNLQDLAKQPSVSIQDAVKKSALEYTELSKKIASFFIPSKNKSASQEKPKTQKEHHFPIDTSMMELFRTELESEVDILNHGLVDFEHTGLNAEMFETLMRAAHSIKGAARVIKVDSIVQLAHAIEDIFVAAKEKQIDLDANHVDIILKAVDFLSNCTKQPLENMVDFIEQQHDEVQNLILQLNFSELQKKEFPSPKGEEQPNIKKDPSLSKKEKKVEDRVLRVTAQNLNRLMGLAGESLVESRWLEPYSNSLLKIKKKINEFDRNFDLIRKIIEERMVDDRVNHYVTAAHHQINEINDELTDRLTDLDMFIFRYSNLSDRLYNEVVESRMRPFADGIGGFPRMVRDLARQLNKKVRLEIIGKSTPVDREILEKLEAPLSHLLRNAVDHGIEPEEERLEKGKPAEGVIKLEAMHKGGVLAITVADDGRGLDINSLKEKILSSHLAPLNVLEQLSEAELLDFLFLPGFSTAHEVTEISGRGVGLSVVQNMIQEVSGTIRATFQPDHGMTFYLLLPLTLSIIRALIVEISGEPYAFPLARIERTLIIPREDIDIIEDRQYFKIEGQNIGLVSAAQVLGIEEEKATKPAAAVIVFNDHMSTFGMVVDRFLAERELVLQELDPRLGKVRDISAGALMEDGSPVLLIDVEDVIRSIDTILSGGRLHKISYADEKITTKKKKNVLVIDDSITVREVECRLLQNHGYDVQSAINGVDGWNVLRNDKFDLVVTDIDMPRMNGIELIKMIRKDERFKEIPILIVSYKEREEDRMAGLEAGANYYLTKSSFHDETLIDVVRDLIGEA